MACLATVAIVCSMAMYNYVSKGVAKCIVLCTCIIAILYIKCVYSVNTLTVCMYWSVFICIHV